MATMMTISHLNNETQKRVGMADRPVRFGVKVFGPRACSLVRRSWVWEP